MRLVCPNCSAQYEIDGSMIPDEGRDVQCSNCGHTWFELPPPPMDMAEMTAEDFAIEGTPATNFEEDDAEYSEDDDLETAEEVIEDVAADETANEETELDAPSASASDMVAEAASEEPDQDEDTDDDGDIPMPGAAIKQRRPDESALDVLREEAERELSQRRAPPSESIETQTDLGLDDIRRRNSPSRALRARMAHLGEDEGDAAEDEKSDRVASAPPPQSVDTTDTDGDDDYVEPRRDLLPDIDEINSTLKPARRREVGGEQGRGGFLAGFLLMLFIAFALIVAYAQAPAIAKAVPNAEGMLISYVDSANAFRDWIFSLTGS